MEQTILRNLYVTGHRDLVLSRDDMRAMEILLERTTKLTSDNHYETGLLWRRDDVQLPNNLREAEMRFQSLRRKFHKDPSLREKYPSTTEDYIAKGYARKLSDEEASKSGIFPILQASAAKSQTKSG